MAVAACRRLRVSSVVVAVLTPPEVFASASTAGAEDGVGGGRSKAGCEEPRLVFVVVAERWFGSVV